jgi:glycosyltransferase involved in cell wall biosynthesis
MSKISSIVICKNEEKNISRCLESLRQVSDEIIVVDSFSEDKTVDIARDIATKVFQREFVSYGDQKNWAISQAIHNNILSLDADECLSDELIVELEELKKRNIDCAYFFTRRINFCGQWIKYGSWNPDQKIRLWDRRSGRWNTPLVHERVEIDENYKIGFLNSPILHYTSHSIDAHIGQINRFSSLKAKELLENNVKPNFIQLFIKPCWKFFWAYIIKLGFLDGYFGFIIAKNSAFGQYLRYAKLYQLRKERTI